MKISTGLMLLSIATINAVSWLTNEMTMLYADTAAGQGFLHSLTKVGKIIFSAQHILGNINTFTSKPDSQFIPFYMLPIISAFLTKSSHIALVALMMVSSLLFIADVAQLLSFEVNHGNGCDWCFYVTLNHVIFGVCVTIYSTIYLLARSFLKMHGN